jgi:hypothetical protein
MKRSNIRRKTPMPPRKAWMPRQSKKRKALMKEVTPARDAYRKEFPKCQCGCGRVATDLHEIAAGAARESALSQREAWLHLARHCHEEIQSWPVVKQCALKFIADPHYLNLSTITDLRGRASSSIVLADLQPYLRMK